MLLVWVTTNSNNPLPNGLSVNNIRDNTWTVRRYRWLCHHRTGMPIRTLFLVAKFVVICAEPSATESTGVGLLT